MGDDEVVRRPAVVSLRATWRAAGRESAVSAGALSPDTMQVGEASVVATPALWISEMVTRDDQGGYTQ